MCQFKTSPLLAGVISQSLQCTPYEAHVHTLHPVYWPEWTQHWFRLTEVCLLCHMYAHTSSACWPLILYQPCAKRPSTFVYALAGKALDTSRSQQFLVYTGFVSVRNTAWPCQLADCHSYWSIMTAMIPTLCQPYSCIVTKDRGLVV